MSSVLPLSLNIDYIFFQILVVFFAINKRERYKQSFSFQNELKSAVVLFSKTHAHGKFCIVRPEFLYKYSFDTVSYCPYLSLYQIYIIDVEYNVYLKYYEICF